MNGDWGLNDCCIVLKILYVFAESQSRLALPLRDRVYDLDRVCPVRNPCFRQGSR